MAIITLTTDFGSHDSYVADMKGVILSINPGATIIDVTHATDPKDIAGAAFTFSLAYGMFPKGTIHVLVVDPGVGSNRKILALKKEGYFFIAPDNGVLSYVLDTGERHTIREVTNKKYFSKALSSTFHGRDIMSPVAAHLSRENIFPSLGRKIDNPFRLSLAKAKRTGRKICGQVIYIDRFGNLITNIKQEDIPSSGVRRVEFKNKTIGELRPNYASVEKGRLVAAIGSKGYLEIAVNCGSAKKNLKARVGNPVVLKLP